jgi:hypothetical protein
MRLVAEAVLALSASPEGFTASQSAEHVPRLSQENESEYGPRRAAYDLKKLRGKSIVSRIGKTARYEPIPEGLRTMAALVILRDKALKPLLAAASTFGGAARHAASPQSTLTIRPFELGCRGILRTGAGCVKADNYCFSFRR